ncbi:membrane-spanning 4-domains subfamily A member 6A isoform X2 [Camelus ferus]|uniref:Membrane-spanning 4-domains subfamily A member 6A isoform X2 n=1 Tax=Camelus ferus TaxID=419612 RepID=A0A8B8TSZ7_CAMFR|nr:membrane-spanning 4-domains subfamily A member 6A isoform X2 [Camelus ferus]
MIPQPVTNESVVVLTPSGIYFPSAEKLKPTTQRQASLKKCLKAEIKVLGTVQIMCGVMVLSLGIILASSPFAQYFTQVFSTLLKAAYPFIGALCAQSTLVANILSSLSALAGFILLSVKLAALGPAFWLCDLPREELTYHHFYPLNFHETIKDCYLAESVLAGTLSLMLICTVLEFFLAVLAAVAWQKQARSDSPESVLFLPEGHKNKSSTTSKAPFDPDCEELLTP